MSGCVFCKIAAGQLESSRILDDELVMALMDIHPWRPGHALVTVKRHAGNITELSDQERDHVFSVVARVAAAMRSSALRCDDLHVVLNDGPAANQSIPHVHVHLVPRWRGDSWRLALRLLAQPFTPLSRPARRADLERRAAQIRAALPAGPRA